MNWLSSSTASFRLWLRHKLGWNRGTIHTVLIGDDIWVGWKCECGRVHGWHKSLATPFAKKTTAREDMNEQPPPSHTAGRREGV